jgi:glycosyltransferase involved in cell wall biosynthesis
VKIALLNRDEGSHLGGDAVQVRGYEAALKKLGHEVKYFHQLFPPINGYNLAILFHINFHWTIWHYQAVKARGYPYKVVAIYYKGVYSDTNHDMMYEILRNAKDVYCLSHAESDELREEFSEIHPKVVNNGVDKELFRDKGLERKYVMTAGRYVDEKGHLRVVEACRELDLPALVVGPDWDKDYKKKCIEGANSKSMILGPVSQEEMSNYYNMSKVYVCASVDERNSLTTLEAASCGCGIVNSIYNRGKEWLSSFAIDIKDKEALKSAIKSVYHQPVKVAHEVPSWDDIVKEILK